MSHPFRVILEVAPPREPDLRKLRRQMELFGGLVDAFLLPDNSLATPAVSSVVLGVEVRRLGGTAVVALNARDRNHLRLESDYLTLRACGIDEVLLLYGDRVERGRSDLTVREMLASPAAGGLRRGVAADPGRRLGWRAAADFLVAKLDFGRVDVAAWRATTGYDRPVYGGVLALGDEAMARRVGTVPGLVPPGELMEAFARDPEVGFRHALGMLDRLRATGVDGAHLVVPSGWRRFAELLGQWRAAPDAPAGGTGPLVLPPSASDGAGASVTLDGRQPVPAGAGPDAGARSGAPGGGPA